MNGPVNGVGTVSRKGEARPLVAAVTVTVLLALLTVLCRPGSAAAARFAAANVSLSTSLSAYAVGISNGGLVLGTQYSTGTSASQLSAYVINADGTAGTLLTGSTRSAPVDISPAGYVLAETLSSAGTVTGTFVYTRQQGTTTLPINATGSINDAGVVAVSTYDGTAFRAARYPTPAGPVQVLDLPSGTTDAFGVGINTAGDVVGSARNAPTGTHYLMVHRNGVVAKYALPAGWTSGSLTDVNAAGQAIGTVSKYAFTYVSRGVYFDGSTVRELPSLSSNPDAISTADAINRHGTAVGSSQAPGTTGYRAVLYDAGRTIDLNTLIDPASGWTLGAAYGINDLGQIVGGGSYAGKAQAFVLTPASSTTWTADASADWTTDANWSAGAPNYSNVAVHFGDAITAPRTVTLSSPRAAGALYFDTGTGYTISGGANGNRLTLSVVSGSAAVHVARGSHTVSAQSTLENDTDIGVWSPDARLTLGRVTAAPGITLRKQGPGTLAWGGIIGRPALAVGEGTVALPGGVTLLSSLALSPTATVQLGTGPLIVDYDGNSPFDALLTHIAAASHDGRWDRPGITSSALLPAAGKGIGIVDGITLGAPGDTSALRILVTFLGDTNLDGVVNAADRTALIAGMQRAAGTATWSDGDFNYDRTVDADDYALFLTGAAAYATPGPATPEPSLLLPLTLAALTPRSRRLRRCPESRRGGVSPPILFG